MFCGLLHDPAPLWENACRKDIGVSPARPCNASAPVRTHPFLQRLAVTAKTGAADCLITVMASPELYKHKHKLKLFFKINFKMTVTVNHKKTTTSQ